MSLAPSGTHQAVFTAICFGDAESARGNHAGAEAHYRIARSLQKNACTADCVVPGTIELRLARQAQLAGHLKAAQPLYAEALGQFERTGNRVLAGEALLMRGNLHWVMKKRGEAQRDAEQACALFAQSLPKTNSKVAACKFALSRLLTAKGKTKQGEKLLTETVNDIEAALINGHIVAVPLLAAVIDVFAAEHHDLVQKAARLDTWQGALAAFGRNYIGLDKERPWELGPKLDELEARIAGHLPRLVSQQMLVLDSIVSRAGPEMRRYHLALAEVTQALTLQIATRTRRSTFFTKSLRAAAAELSLHARGRAVEELGSARQSLLESMGNEDSRALLRQIDAKETQLKETGEYRAIMTDVATNRETLRKELDTLYRQVEERIPGAATLFRVPSLSELKDKIEERSLVVEYLRLKSGQDNEEHYYALVVEPWPDSSSYRPLNPDTVTSVMLRVTRDVIRQTQLDCKLYDLGPAKPLVQAAELLRDAARVGDNRAVVDDLADQFAPLLYKRALSGGQPLRSWVKKLIIVPDEGLAAIPFDLLAERYFQGLGQEAPLVSLAGSARDVAGWRTPRRQATVAAGFFRPDFGSSATLRFVPLDVDHLEEAAFSRAFTTNRIWSKGEVAKRSLNALSGPVVLHLSTHARFDAVRGDYNPETRSGIALASANTSTDEGFMTTRELAKLDLRGTQLVVISACETGMGRSSYSGGFEGIQRSLTLAGSEAQLLTLWRVSAHPAAKLISYFYSGLLRTGTSKAEALRDAKQQMRKDGYGPRDWAAFALFGDPRPLDLSVVREVRGATK